MVYVVLLILDSELISFLKNENRFNKNFYKTFNNPTYRLKIKNKAQNKGLLGFL